MKIYRVLLIILALIPAVCTAQTSLTKILDSLEDSDKVRDVIYQEKRDPKSHKIYECKRIFTFTDSKMARRIVDAFKKERSNSVKYQVNVDKESSLYVIEFRKDRNKTRYTLIKDSGQKWTFVYQLAPGNKRFSDVSPADRFTDRKNAMALGQLALQILTYGEGDDSSATVTDSTISLMTMD